LEAAIVEFEDKYNAAKEWQEAAYAARAPNWTCTEFECFGRVFDVDHFRIKNVYDSQPEFTALDEWFEKQCQYDSSELASFVARGLLIPNQRG
jgi:hypothetical protein